MPANLRRSLMLLGPPLTVYGTSQSCTGPEPHDVTLIFDGAQATAYGTVYGSLDGEDPRDDYGRICPGPLRRTRHLMTVTCGQRIAPDSADSCPGTVTWDLTEQNWRAYRANVEGYLIQRHPLNIETAEEDTPETWEPDALNLAAAARWLLLLRDDGNLRGSQYIAAMGIWGELIGTDDARRAIAYAERIQAAGPAAAAVAFVPPF